MKAKNLDSVSKEEKKATLSNTISRCMIENHMTLENLDEACEIVREIYKKNATMKGWQEASPSLSIMAWMTTEITAIEIFIWMFTFYRLDSIFAIIEIADVGSICNRRTEGTFFCMNFMATMFICIVIEVIKLHIVHSFHNYSDWYSVIKV